MGERSRKKKSRGSTSESDSEADAPRKRRPRSGNEDRPRKKRRKAALESEDSGSEDSGLVIDEVDSTSEGEEITPTLSLSELTRDLESSSAKRRESAAHGLGQLGAKAKRTVPKLAELLTDPEERVQLRAARALGKIGPAASAAVPALALTLKQTGGKDRSRDETTVAGVAVRALKRIGSPAWPGLLGVFDDKDLRRRAARVLRSIEPRADEKTEAAIEDLLEVGREDAAEAAVAVLARHGEAAVPLLLRFATADDAPELQDQAEDALEAIGKDAVPGLASALDEGDVDLRLSAVRNLGRIARTVSQRAVAKVCSRLEDALDDDDVGVRLLAVDALGALTEYGSRAQQPLIVALGDTDSRVGLAAVMALLDLADDRVVLAKRMVEVLEGRELEFTRVGACMVLMHLGPTAKESVSALLKALEDRSTEVREYAHLALQAIRTPSMRISVIRTASLRLKVVDESDEEEEGSGPATLPRGGGPVAPRKRRRAGAVRPRRKGRRR